MRCPFCQCDDTRVVDSRLTDHGDAVRRRRACECCGDRFTTLERPSLRMPHIVKTNGNREAYNETKLRRGIERALEKRPVESDEVESMIHRINRALLTSGLREMPSQQLGEFIMDELRKLDQVAFVRFASVYRSFQDVDEFSAEIRRLQDNPQQEADKDEDEE